jgi:dehydrogenase/reductase SDR family protein 7
MILLVLILLVVFVYFVLNYDADMTTILYEKYGQSLSKFFAGKVVWVTGASSGIGKAVAVEAAKNGAKVVISARRASLLNEVRNLCISNGTPEGNILVLPLDVCDSAALEPAFQKVLKTFGGLDVLILNAGRSQRARWEHTDLQVDRDLFELNVFSVVNLTRVVLPYMTEKKGGHIAVMSSSAGKAGVPFSGSYTGSKHAVHGYFESLRNEKVESGINITMLCPGPTFSDLLQVAATEKPDEAFGESMTSGDKRMTAERCAQLSLVAIANNLAESWICFKPVLLLMYASQYMPTVSKWAFKRFLGPKFLAKVRDSRNAMESAKYE